MRCSSCDNILGHVESISGGFRLGKLNLAIVDSDLDSVTVYDKEKWLACLLLCAIENKGVRKFVVRNGNGVLKLWIFSPGLTISSSAMDSADPIRVVKVMWQLVDASEDNGSDRLTTAAMAEDELRLMPSEQELLQEVLQKSASVLTVDGRMFQDWNVGLLKRFASVDGIER